MQKTLNIRGKDYEIQEFSNLHIGVLQQFLISTASLDFGIQAQNDIGFVLKEVILPGLPDNLIKKIAEGKYVLLLDMEEVSQITAELSRYFAEMRLSQAKEREDSEAIAKYQKMLKDLADDDMTDDEFEQLKKEIAELKSQVQPTVPLDEVAALKKELAELKNQ
ncbi:hypothetical protein Xen7305DRAFT_00008650 [Xenococcus sp. PCC 7305]|uniref:hypothetical protein n=1 Tax=Xenococcus sp. PCC 7305 TaxID=102125 RepID=UPI0002AC565B|nr:hypothetical protein [Xenococcus sp. PCC 7305]ELS01163.1 hypothetical protein Xen7305DRAFT_00008650 [Xenococcus sp. PCC 7305]